MEMRTKNCTKISGYLEKKGKRKMIGLYKKYWFVLEGGLLLYYRSKDDYETISPCKGTINLGPPCIVKPCPSIPGVFQLQTRTSTITLRAENRDEQTKWMQAIVSEVSPQKAVQRMSHFRYSLESVETPPHEDIIQRLQRMGAHSYSPLGRPPLDCKDSKSSEHLYEMVSRGEEEPPRSSTLPARRQRARPESMLVENVEYAGVGEKRPRKKVKSLFGRRDSKVEYLTVVNDCYAGVKKRELEEMIDHNENELVDGEDVNRSGEENAYSIPCFFDDEVRNEVLYEDIERNNVEYAEPTIVQEQVQGKKKNKKKQEKKAPVAEKPNKVKKQTSFIRRVWRIIEKKDEKKEPVQEIIKKDQIDKPPADDSSALRMLSELQNLLEQKMPVLTEKLATNTTRTKFDHTKQDPDKTKQPQLPSSTLTADNPRHPEPHQMAALPPKKLRKPPEQDKSLDEILHELDAQPTKGKENTVRRLIQRFSEPDFADGVVLRGRRAARKDDVDADELGRLLQELAKVTSAPVLAPGVTSSLNGASLNDEEFSRLLPMKQRRFSEPDYDVPRPHKSLTIMQRREMMSENVIGSTRFFGPILKPVDLIVANNRPCSPSQLHSITPDSLEMGEGSEYCKFVNRRSRIKEREEPDECSVENEIYAEPRSISSGVDRPGAQEAEYEEFVDSLEIYRNEISTNF
ncbi:unnamed protein product [Phyllotreta striolata]|uniref:PH domain-containing protein n=1 Tax=Phyllotreta striolata TaxID=444603 RepID=A0A9N9XSL6_PHYSR|nr:unnamed protein product [Phyllotreta striolata]